MNALAPILGLLALASGLLKLFGKGERPGSVRLLAFLEALAGVCFPLFVLAGSPGPVILGILGLGVLGLILGSSAHQLAWARSRRRYREETEAGRLVTYVKYLSGSSGGNGPGRR